MGLTVGNKIELVKLSQIIQNDKNKKVFQSKVCDVLPKNMLQIAMPIYEGKIVPLEINDKYSACFYTDKGLMQCNVLVTSRYRSGNLFFLEVLMLGKLEKVQRREFYRYKCIMDGKIRVVPDEEFDAEGLGTYIPPENYVWENVKILDISGGGAKIVNKVFLEKNEVIKLNFIINIIDDVAPMSLFARILSNNGVEGHEGLYEQRLEFMKIHQEDRDKIIKFIFESERHNRAKEAGLS